MIKANHAIIETKHILLFFQEVVVFFYNFFFIFPLYSKGVRLSFHVYITITFFPHPILGIYPDKTLLKRDTCTHMFIAALFTITKIWKQPKCPSTDDWIRKMWYIYTMEYYSAIKKNTTMPFAATWMELETLILSDISQKDKDKYHMISLITGI